MNRQWFVLLLASVVLGCPYKELIAPKCICKNLGSGSQMLCKGFLNAEELIPPIKATFGVDMFALAILDSSFLFVPSKLFVGTKYEKIRFADTQLMSLTDTDLAFEGLEDRLEELRVSGKESSTFITDWDWSTLRNHRRLKLIDIYEINMYTVDQELPALDSLQFLSVSKAGISFLHPMAFHNLVNLRLLILKENEISELHRSMLPDSATQLTLIDLSGNDLVDIPKDMFRGMPNLEELVLSNNKLVTLDEETFQGVMQRVNTLMLNGNHFRCDCRLRWLVHNRTPHTFQANCDLPEILKGHNLKDLQNHQIWC